MNPLDKRRLYLNQQNQNKSSDWSERKDLTSFNDVYITMISQIYEIFTSIASLATHVKNQDNPLKWLMSQKMADKSNYDELFSSNEGEPEGANRNNGSLVRGQLKSSKRGRNNWYICTQPTSFDVCAMITVRLRLRSSNVPTVETNSNKKTSEDDSHANTTCLGGGGPSVF